MAGARGNVLSIQGALQEKKIPVSGIYAGVGRSRTIFHSGDSKSITKGKLPPVDTCWGSSPAIKTTGDVITTFL